MEPYTLDQLIAELTQLKKSQVGSVATNVFDIHVGSVGEENYRVIQLKTELANVRNILDDMEEMLAGDYDHDASRSMSQRLRKLATQV